MKIYVVSYKRDSLREPVIQIQGDSITDAIEKLAIIKQLPITQCELIFAITEKEYNGNVFKSFGHS
jgi:hypothetical protein